MQTTVASTLHKSQNADIRIASLFFEPFPQLRFKLEVSVGGLQCGLPGFDPGSDTSLLTDFQLRSEILIDSLMCPCLFQRLQTPMNRKSQMFPRIYSA